MSLHRTNRVGEEISKKQRGYTHICMHFGKAKKKEEENSTLNIIIILNLLYFFFLLILFILCI